MLSFEAIRKFERDGYIGPFALPSGLWQELGVPIAARARAVARLGPGGLSKEVFRNQHVHSPSLVRLVTAPPILEDVCALLGNDVLLWLAQVLPRPPGQEGARWHSDSINQFVRGVHVSLALTDMSLRNGCLKVIPGSHLYRASLTAASERGGIDAFDDGGFRKLADRVAPWHAPHHVVPIEMKAGEYFLMWGGLWHCVGRNISDAHRVAAVARFARTDFACRHYGFRDCEIANGAPLPCILVSGKDDHGLNQLQTPSETDLYAPS